MTSTNHPTVTVLNGAEAGTILPIDEVLNDFAVGSYEGCHLVLSGASVSPVHASMFLDDEGRVTVSDPKSAGGVYVNGTRVTEQELSHGDEISLGPPDNPESARLRFGASGAEAPRVDSEPDPSLQGLADLPSPFAGGEPELELAPAKVDVLPPLETVGETERQLELMLATVDALPRPEWLGEAEAPLELVLATGETPRRPETPRESEPPLELVLATSQGLRRPEMLSKSEPPPERVPAATDALPPQEMPSEAEPPPPPPERVPATADVLPPLEMPSEAEPPSERVPAAADAPPPLEMPSEAEPPPEGAPAAADALPPLGMQSEAEPPPEGAPAPEPELTPVAPTPAPVTPTPAPVPPTPALVTPTPTPVTPTPTPVTPTPALVTPTPALVTPTPAPVQPPKATPAKPMAEARPAVALVTPASPRPDAGKTTSRTKAPEDAGDPLAKTLGGGIGERFVPPPVVEAPVARAAAAKSPVVRAAARKKWRVPPRIIAAARIAAVAGMVGGLAWFGVQKYSKWIAVPVVDTYVPNPVEPGQTLTINGSGFGSASTSVKVTLDSVEAQVLDANPTRISITVPESLGASGPRTLSLKVEAPGGTSTDRPLKLSVIPKVTALAPLVALTGDEVVITGRWLANAETKPVVTVAGKPAEVLEATSSQVRVKIPAVAAPEGQRVPVKVGVGTETSNEALLNYGRLPFVATVSPVRALPGDIITLTGLGFSVPDLSVRVGSHSAALLSATDTEVKFSVPGLRLSESAGPRALTVKANELTSAPHTIEILRDSAASYSPRFFVEILESARASVSCDFGPVMVLGADAPSRTRAHDAAARLNALASGGRTDRVQFTAGDATINAPGGPVLVVAAGDASGNPRVMASLWAAYLTDLFDLFLQGRRPGRVVELSPDGAVLLDIFATARRRSAEPGVPQGLISSPDPAWLRSLANLAAAPTLGSGQALALLDGYWAGVIEVPGAIQPRKVEISLTVTPSGLVGQSTSRQGGLSSDITLRNLTYARRELRFSFVDSGEALVYQGRLDGDLIDGTVTKPSGARVGKLTFKLTR